jgi:hypothetical protein
LEEKFGILSLPKVGFAETPFRKWVSPEYHYEIGVTPYNAFSLFSNSFCDSFPSFTIDWTILPLHYLLTPCAHLILPVPSCSGCRFAAQLEGSKDAANDDDVQPHAAGED